jgi:sacsin
VYKVQLAIFMYKNELLQNADDAGATEVHFVLDMRYHGTDHIFGDQWIPFQGPALCVFNDTCFSTKEMFKGIRRENVSDSCN